MPSVACVICARAPPAVLPDLHLTAKLRYASLPSLNRAARLASSSIARIRILRIPARGPKAVRRMGSARLIERFWIRGA
jgi:hypothetical protein